MLGWAGRLAEGREWFIQKAIGWWLRVLSKRDPERVRRFLTEHGGKLTGVAKREATKYLKADGGVPRAGDHIALDDLAGTQDDRSAGAFYEGPVAQKIVDAVQAAGGRMTMDDLAHYRAVEREPVSGTYRGRAIASMPPASSGGAHIVEILSTPRGLPLRRAGVQLGRLAA